MRQGLWIGLLLLIVPAVAGRAEEMARSLRPVPNPAYALPAPAALPAAAAAAGGGEGTATALASAPSGQGLALSLRPRPRPDGLAGAGAGLDLAGLSENPAEPGATATKKKKKAPASGKGSVCGVAAIKGEAIAPIRSKVKGCGLKEGVRVTSVSGVRLSQAITVDCATARALNAWVADVVQPAYGQSVAELRIAAHYICRPRNNKAGAKISEHGRGKAVDVAGFVLDNGKEISVLKGYDKKLRRVHKAACGLFSTTLGPGSDGYHEDHLHFDTASHRSGTYCR